MNKKLTVFLVLVVLLMSNLQVSAFALDVNTVFLQDHNVINFFQSAVNGQVLTSKYLNDPSTSVFSKSLNVKTAFADGIKHYNSAIKRSDPAVWNLIYNTYVTTPEVVQIKKGYKVSQVGIPFDASGYTVMRTNDMEGGVFTYYKADITVWAKKANNTKDVAFTKVERRLKKVALADIPQNIRTAIERDNYNFNNPEFRSIFWLSDNGVCNIGENMATSFIEQNNSDYFVVPLEGKFKVKTFLLKPGEQAVIHPSNVQAFPYGRYNMGNYTEHCRLSIISRSHKAKVLISETNSSGVQPAPTMYDFASLEVGDDIMVFDCNDIENEKIVILADEEIELFATMVYTRKDLKVTNR